jgi:class 3 adenylate cyclase
VLSNDEFALFAQKTNDMIQGLQDRDFCRASFDKYVSPEVSKKILDDDISPTGELYDVTILFCDLRGYTSFVERRNPVDVVDFMNRYFSEMERIIRHHHGLVLQYIGDEIEAVFGAPAPLGDHPDKAVAAALDMRAALARMNAALQAEGSETVAHGVGIHSGTVLAGDVGSESRKVYAMVGDTVNTASRLQVLNKTCGTDILISRSTVDRLTENRPALKSLGIYPIKGKRQEVEVFTIAS